MKELLMHDSEREHPFPPYASPFEVGIDAGNGKEIYPLPDRDRARAVWEILQCTDLMILAQGLDKRLCAPRLFSDDIVFDGKSPCLVYDATVGRVVELHFSALTERCELRGILFYRDGERNRAVLEIYQDKYLFTLISARQPDGSFRPEHIRRQKNPHNSKSWLRRHLPEILLSAAILGVAASLVFAYLDGRSSLAASSSVSDSATSDLSNRVEPTTKDEIALLRFTDSVKVGGTVSVSVLVEPSVLLTLNGDSALGLPLSARCDESGIASFSFQLSDSVSPGSYSLAIATSSASLSLKLTVTGA